MCGNERKPGSERCSGTQGEKIDIIPYHIDPAKFVCNALAPAEISRVIIDEENRSMEVIVPDEFLSIAIGKKGQNVRLASKLTKWHLDVISESRYSQAMQDGYDSLVALPGVGVSLADSLYEKGFYSAEELSHASIEDLIQIRGIAGEKAQKLIENAKKYMAAVDNINEAPIEESLEDQEDFAGRSELPARPDLGAGEASEKDTGESEDTSTNNQI